ncbi:MAG: PAS domain S-box protein [Deltaproteobacteria bacterium]|nr:PAS domain S-box protein [Deltaproteobacteria bacterium]
MADKPTYEELEQRVKELEKKTLEREGTEEALRESEERYRTVLEANPDPVVVYDIEGKVIYFNPAFTRVFGWTIEERISKKMDEFVPEESWEETKFMIDKVLAGESFSGIETRRFTKEGKIIPISISGAIYRDPDNKPIGSVINLRNISAQKTLETQLQQALKMESIGTLTGGIAHDFNNILGIIIGNTELAMDDVPEWNPAHFNLKEIKTASIRAKDIVRQLLTFSRKTDQERKPIKIIQTIKDSLKFLRATIPTSIDIRQNIRATDDTVLADPTQIHQLMMNLCTNASHAVETGGTIEVGIENIVLDEDSAVLYPDLIPGNYVKVTVSDTGQGIAPEATDRIFDPYFTTKEVGKGTGMGLSVVHGIVKSHGGAIIVESELGKGTTFSVFFPVIEKQVDSEIEIDEKLPTGNERILFVDDEESMVYVGRYRLERLGYQVEAQTSPVQALKLFQANPDQFDLLITDMAMPRMTGDMLVKEILKIRPDIPTILCTGFSEKIDEERSKKLGISAYIVKPFDRRDLAKLVRKVLP